MIVVNKKTGVAIGRPATPCKVTNFLALFLAFVAIFLAIRLGLSLIFTYFAV